MIREVEIEIKLWLDT